jgi:hypothetical protein
MTDVANAVDGENASVPAAAKAAPKDPWALPDVSHLVVGVLGLIGVDLVVRRGELASSLSYWYRIEGDGYARASGFDYGSV